MQYMGGKSRLAPHLAKVILDSTTNRGIYLEPFVGGGAMFATMAPHFHTPIASDLHQDVALLWQAVAEGWEPPSTVSEDEYAALRHAEPSAIRGFVGFGCSFGGKWFGGYARGDAKDGYAAQQRRTVLRQEPSFRGSFVLWAHYAEMEIFVGGQYGRTVVYCDPPYAGTTSYKGAPPFDHALFWRTMNEWHARGAHVFVSEYTAPAGWDIMFEREHRVVLQGASEATRSATERLFTRRTA